MGFHNIEKKSFAYNALYHYVAFWHNKVFYRKIIKLNEHHIPEKDPAIFTPNHQNALMDALALLFTIKRQLVFMARSDIFKKFASILYFLKILPIYRIRDGIDSLKNNKKVFDKTVDVLNAQNGLVILPEGNHKGERRLRQLKKGFARIAFQTQMEGSLNSPIKIVPVGIDYDDYVHCRSRLLVNFGEPFEILQYLDDYKKNPAVALNKVKEELSQRIKKLIIHIESEQHYHFINEWRVYYRREMCRFLGLDPNKEEDGFVADQKLVNCFNMADKTEPGTLQTMHHVFDAVENILSKYKLQLKDTKKKPHRLKNYGTTLLLIITSPIFLYGAVNHLLPFFLPYYLSRKVKDVMFHSSFMYVLTMLFFPVFYLIQTFLVYKINGSFTTAAIYLVTLPVAAAFSWKWFRQLKTVVKNFKLIRLTNSSDYQPFQEYIRSLFETTKEITKKYVQKI